MCIVHNDTLLDDDKSYVGLLYEIVRVKPTFIALAEICKYEITISNVFGSLSDKPQSVSVTKIRRFSKEGLCNACTTQWFGFIQY